MKFSKLFCIAVLAFMNATVQAQNATDSAVAPQESLVKVLEAAKEATLRGSIEISKENPPAKGNQNGLVGRAVRIQVMGVGGGSTRLFTGSLDVFVDDGAIAAATLSGLPQVKVYSKGDQKLISQVYSKSTKDFGQAMELMVLAFDFDSLIEEVNRAKLVRSKDLEGGKQFRVTLASEAFEKEETAAGPGRAAMLARSMVQESILEGVLVADTDSSGELKKMSLEFQYNNPVSSLIRMGGQGPAAMQLNLGDIKKNTELGHKITVVFIPNADQGKTAEAFAAEAVVLLEAEGK